MATIPSISAQLIRTYNLRNTRVINGQKNPYDSKIAGTVTLDKELYKSALGTPVLSDITFGDKINLTNNQWTDNNNKIQSFDPVTFACVLFSVSQAKIIVKTQIQGRDGSVKEYIGKDDYSVQIDGIITGANGHYPIDEVKALKKMLDAPIPLIVTSWYLQNLDIDMLVVNSYDIDQDAGGYSYQNFSIKCISDIPVELKISNV